MPLRYVRFIPLAALVLALPMRADAQLGGLLKKAKEKIIAPEQPSAQATKVEAIGDPFDETSLTATIAGLKVMAAKQAEIAALDKQASDLGTQSGALQEKNKKAIDEYHTNERVISTCIDHDMESRRSAVEAAAGAKMMERSQDPKFLDEVMKIQTALQEAYAKRDTISVKKLTEQFAKITGTAPDSTASFKKCGRLPAKPAAMVEAERLDKQREGIVAKMRDIQSSSEVEAARAAKTTPAKLMKQKERLVTYQSDKKPFSPQEQQVISARNAEIKPLIK